LFSQNASIYNNVKFAFGSVSMLFVNIAISAYILLVITKANKTFANVFHYDILIDHFVINTRLRNACIENAKSHYVFVNIMNYKICM